MAAHVHSDRPVSGSQLTIILSLIHADYALQISDRLLTLEKDTQYQPWDQAANKSIVLLASIVHAAELSG